MSSTSSGDLRRVTSVLGYDPNAKALGSFISGRFLSGDVAGVPFELDAKKKGWFMGRAPDYDGTVPSIFGRCRPNEILQFAIEADPQAYVGKYEMSALKKASPKDGWLPWASYPSDNVTEYWDGWYEWTDKRLYDKAMARLRAVHKYYANSFKQSPYPLRSYWGVPFSKWSIPVKVKSSALIYAHLRYRMRPYVDRVLAAVRECNPAKLLELRGDWEDDVYSLSFKNMPYGAVTYATAQTRGQDSKVAGKVSYPARILTPGGLVPVPTNWTQRMRSIVAIPAPMNAASINVVSNHNGFCVLAPGMHVGSPTYIQDTLGELYDVTQTMSIDSSNFDASIPFRFLADRVLMNLEHGIVDKLDAALNAMCLVTKMFIFCPQYTIGGGEDWGYVIAQILAQVNSGWLQTTSADSEYNILLHFALDIMAGGIGGWIFEPGGSKHNFQFIKGDDGTAVTPMWREIMRQIGPLGDISGMTVKTEPSMIFLQRIYLPNGKQTAIFNRRLSNLLPERPSERNEIRAQLSLLAASIDTVDSPYRAQIEDSLRGLCRHFLVPNVERIVACDHTLVAELAPLQGSIPSQVITEAIARWDGFSKGVFVSGYYVPDYEMVETNKWSDRYLATLGSIRSDEKLFL